MAHFFKGESKYCGLFAFKNNALSSAAAADAMTNHSIAHKVKYAPFNLIGCVGLGFHTMKNCQHAWLCEFVSDKYDASE
jgi:hypothetical protein